MAIETQNEKKVLPVRNEVTEEVWAEEILKSTSHYECLDEVLELVDLEKRKDTTLYSDEYKAALVTFVEQYDVKASADGSFDQFVLQIVLTGCGIEEQSLVFYNKLNLMALSVINAIYQVEMTVAYQCAMYHMQISAAEISMNIYALTDKDFYLSKARQHFVMGVSFVQEISPLKAFEAQLRISDVDIEMIMNENDVKIVEQAIVDTHNVVELSKCIKHEKTKYLIKRYADLCGLLSEYRIDDREYWREYSVELADESASYSV